MNEASPKKRELRKLSGYFLGIALFFVSAWGLQKLILNRALAISLQTARQLSEALPHSGATESAENSYFFPLFPFSPEQLQRPHGPNGAEGGEAEQDALVIGSAPDSARGVRSHGANSSTAARRPSNAAGDLDGPPTPGPTPQSVRAHEARVLAWANGQMVPQGRTAQASFGMPAGIELFQVTALGVGLRDRDRLIAVDGAPVSDRAEVVAAVLGARGREQEVIVATLVRMTDSGPVNFQVVIEQPYLSEQEIEQQDAQQASEVANP